MRHNKKNNHLGRTSSHRKAMLSNMASSLIMHKRINTTLAKAKALRCYIEPLITRSKNDNTHNRRIVFSSLQDKYAVSELFREVAIKIGERPGGYTRILKTEARSGDNAEMCIIELVDYNESLLEAKATDKKQTRRSRRGGKKKIDETAKTDIEEQVDEADVEVEDKEESAVEEKTQEVDAEVESKDEVKEEAPATEEKEVKQEKTEEIKEEEQTESKVEEKVQEVDSEVDSEVESKDEVKEETPATEEKEVKPEEKTAEIKEDEQSESAAEEDSKKKDDQQEDKNK